MFEIDAECEEKDDVSAGFVLFCFAGFFAMFLWDMPPLFFSLSFSVIFFSLAFGLSLCVSLFSLSLSLSLSHTHTLHTHSLSLSLTHTTLSLSLSLTHTHTYLIFVLLFVLLFVFKREMAIICCRPCWSNRPCVKYRDPCCLFSVLFDLS